MADWIAGLKEAICLAMIFIIIVALALGALVGFVTFVILRASQ